MNLIRLVAPAVPLVTEAELKREARIDHADDVARALLRAASAEALVDGWPAGWLGRALVTQTWRLDLRAWWAEPLRLPLPPTQAVEAVAFDDPAGAEQSIDVGDLQTFTRDGRLYVQPPAEPPALATATEHPVRVTFRAGYGDTAAAVPAAIREAVLVSVVRRIDDPTTAPALTETSMALLAPYRVWE